MAITLSQVLSCLSLTFSQNWQVVNNKRCFMQTWHRINLFTALYLYNIFLLCFMSPVPFRITACLMAPRLQDIEMAYGFSGMPHVSYAARVSHAAYASYAFYDAHVSWRQQNLSLWATCNTTSARATRKQLSRWGDWKQVQNRIPSWSISYWDRDSKMAREQKGSTFSALDEPVRWQGVTLLNELATRYLHSLIHIRYQRSHRRWSKLCMQCMHILLQM